MKYKTRVYKTQFETHWLNDFRVIKYKIYISITVNLNKSKYNISEYDDSRSFAKVVQVLLYK